MAKAFNGLKRVNSLNPRQAARYLFKALFFVLLLSQIISPLNPNQCHQADAFPLETHLFDHLITKHILSSSTTASPPPSLSDSDPFIQESSFSSKTSNITNVIGKFLVSSSNDQVINLTDSRPETSLFVHHSSDHYKHFESKDSKLKVSFALEIVIRVSIFIYCCLVIGYLCDEYFVPSLENIGQALNLRADLIGAILIPFGTSGPEIFSSAVGVFFAENDIGTGAIIGSGVFNILAIPAASGLAASYFLGDSIRLEKGPILRDLTFYVISIIVLILAIKDNTVDFIDSFLFTILFVVYIGVMFYNVKEQTSLDSINSKSIEEEQNTVHRNQHQQQNNQQCRITSYQGYHLPKMTINNFNFKTDLNNGGKNKMKEYLNKCNEMIINEKEPFLNKVAKLYDIEKSRSNLNEYLFNENNKGNRKEVEQKFCIFIDDIINKQNVILERKTKIEYEKLEPNDDNGVGFTDNKILRILLMPFILIYSISMPIRFPFITFLFSILWLSFLSYVTVWSISGLSDLIGIPSTVSGMTILAAGSAVPDLVTSIIVIKKSGQASMGICAAIASNIFAILLGLGLPWTIRFVLNWIKYGNYISSLIALQSNALPYTLILLMIVVAFLYVTLRICDWKISKRFSLICFLIHLVFIVCSISMEISIS